MNWKKLLRNMLFGIGGLLLLLVAASFIILRYYEDEVVDYALRRINDRLSVHAHVGEAHLVLWKTFPNASVHLSDVMIKDSFGRGDTLFTAGDVFLSFHVWKLFSGNYTLDRISAAEVGATLKKNRKGITNWNVWKPSPGTDSTHFSLDLNTIVLSDAQVVYEDEQSRFFIDLFAGDARASGNFSGDDVLLSLSLEGRMEQLIQGQNTYATEAPLALNGDLRVNGAAQTLEVSRCTLSSEGMQLITTATLAYGDKTSFTLAARGERLSVETLLPRLPEAARTALQPYNPAGTMSVELTVTNRNPKKHTVADATFRLDGASLRRQDAGVGVEELEANGTCRIAGGLAAVTVEQCRGQLEAGWFDIRGDISQHPQWRADLSLKAGASLPDLRAFLGWDTLETCQGQVEVDAAIRGTLDEQTHWLRAVNGSVTVSEGAAQLKGSNKLFDQVNGRFTLHEGAATVEQLKGRVNGNEIEITGELRNLTAFLTTPEAVLHIAAVLQSPHIDMATLLEQHSGSNRDDYRLSLPQGITCEIDTHIEKFTFGKFEASAIHCVTSIQPGRADVSALSFQTAGGSVNSRLTLVQDAADRFRLYSLSTLERINISSLFEEFDNFGQTTITRNHLRGTANAQVQFTTPVSTDLRINTEAMESLIDIRIQDGQLIGLESLQAVAVYLKNNKWVAPFVNEDAFADKLKNIRFSSLENLIEIKNRQVFIPAMDIRSSAMDVTIKGKHSFDNAIDYTIGFNLRDVLVRKERAIAEADDGLGKQMFLYMRGTTAQPEFGLDQTASKAHRRDALETEKQNVKALLKEEFGWFGKDSLATPYRDPSQVSGTITSVEWDEKPTATGPATGPTDKKEEKTPAPQRKKTPKWLQENAEESTPVQISVDD